MTSWNKKRCSKCGIQKDLHEFHNLGTQYKQNYCKECMCETSRQRRMLICNEVIGIIGDTHEPFTHPNYISFIIDTFAKYGVTKVIHGGDLVDNHAISRHISEPDAMGAVDEYKRAKIGVSKWTRVFPEVILLKGNHDEIPVRQARELGIPSSFLKNLNEVWELPKGWITKESVIIDNVMYEHGVGSNGMYGARNSSLQMAMSYVQGHAHSGGGIYYTANPYKLWFGLNVGCGIDVDAYSMRYGKTFKRKPTLGCGIVKSSTEAYFVPMDLNKKYKRRSYV